MRRTKRYGQTPGLRRRSKNTKEEEEEEEAEAEEAERGDNTQQQRLKKKYTNAPYAYARDEGERNSMYVGTQ